MNTILIAIFYQQKKYASTTTLWHKICIEYNFVKKIFVFKYFLASFDL